ncbi:MAG: hypothetical protein IPM46_02205 [Flavobacteriales bacterium]|nr:hypothetical protein [Flavobacteriales bacterium]
MIHITIQTRTRQDAERLAMHLMQHQLLLFPTLDTDHEELKWIDGELIQESQVLLQGMSKALLYSMIERSAYEVLCDAVIRMHGVPITNMDAHAQRMLLEQTAKV